MINEYSEARYRAPFQPWLWGAVLAAISAGAPVHAQNGCLAPPSGLVSWWAGDSSNNDIVGSNNPNNASAVSLVPAEVSNGFSIGKNGYLEVQASKSLANQKFTWSVWVKPLGAGPNNDSTGSSIVQQDIDDYSLSMALYWRSMDNRFLFVFGNTGSETVASKDTFTTGSFYHVATTYDGNAFDLWVNGALEGTFTEAKTVAYSTNPWTIGSSGQSGTSAGFGRTLNGIVDEVQAFNRALSQSELQSIYNAGSAGECKPAAASSGSGGGTGTGSGNAAAGTGSGSIVNAASYANPSMPSAGIAQGSLFTVFGSNLGPSNSPSLSFPLSTTLGGVSVSVTQGSTRVAAIPVFVSPSQVNAIMPSNAPLGLDSVTVSYQGQNISVGNAAVLQNGFGIFSVNSSGSGQGIVTSASNSIIGYNSAAHPGDALIIWGTGLGAISGSDANAPPVGNIGAAPTVYFGGTQVTPTYFGRSGCCSGLDQIVFQVPQNVAGCNIPVSVQSGNTVSNFVSVAVASSGNSCTDPSGFSAAQLTTLASQVTAAVGSIVYNTYNSTSLGFNLFGGGSTQVSTGTQELATFDKYQMSNVTNFAQVLNSGACTVYNFSGRSFPGAGVLNATGLDAGSSLTASGGGAQGQIQQSSTKGTYSAAYLLPNGSITFTGSGGASVGAFSVALPVASQTLKWTNEGSIGTINRSNGVTVTWSGGDSSGTVQISGYSVGSGASGAIGAGFSCTAPASAGQFAVPAAVLLALPPSASQGSGVIQNTTGFLGITQSTSPVMFSASGLDLGYALTEATITNSTVTYQ